jgi:GntR family transcriptional regulator
VPIPPTLKELIADLSQRIDAGEFPPGSQLPSGQALAKAYGVSPRTVQSALAALRKQGTVVGRPGRGVFVAEVRKR